MSKPADFVVFAAVIGTLLTACNDASPTAVAPAYAAPARRPKPRVKQPIELGQVRWIRDFKKAQQASRRNGKPMLVLFDEVPGCHTVRTFGKTVLSHPLVVEAIETLFVPVVVYNNVGGVDRKVLTSFREPAWNNPVVRIMDAGRRELATRYAGDYTVRSLTKTMIAALTQAKRPIPGYLRLLGQEQAAQGRHSVAMFAMHCFWSGEAAIGGIDGVTATKTGFAEGREVVLVTFDAARLGYSRLVQRVKALGAADAVLTLSAQQSQTAARLKLLRHKRSSARAFRHSPKDDKYQLSRSPLRFLPMTPLQATRVNAALGRASQMPKLLSPRQLALHNVIARRPTAGWIDRRGGKVSFEASYAQSMAIADKVGTR